MASDSPPDKMNSPAFDPPPPPPAPRRRSTLTSQASTTGTLNPDTCRICRSEGTPTEPLFHPCKCSGSIKFVHQECLIEWLGHSNKKHCELCKTPFRFTKLYDAHMPLTLPWAVFCRRATWHVVKGMVRVARLGLVGVVWFGVIPWIVRWVWRWLFWVADAAWSREAFLELIRPEQEAQQSTSGLDWVSRAFWQFRAPLNHTAVTFGSQQPFMMTLAQDLGLINGNTTSTDLFMADEPSMLSDWSYLSTMTDSKRMNRLILDVFEGQLITCVILTSFILVFLLREWVVQQQPLVNLDGIGNAQNQLREAAEQVQADHERLRRQQDLLDQARRRLAELQDEAGTLANVEHAEDLPVFEGWESLEKLIDDTTQHLKQDGENEHDLFLAGAKLVTQQIRAAGKNGEELDGFTNKVYKKFASYPEAERREWEGVLVSEIEENAAKRGASRPDQGTAERGQASSESPARPLMPSRDVSSRATNIQRLLHEADSVSPPGQGPAAERTRTFQDDSNTPDQPAHGPTQSQSPRSDADSWEQITPSAGSRSPTEANPMAIVPSLQRQNSQASTAPRAPTRFDKLPVANAGPDARINIRQSSFVNDSGERVRSTQPLIQERMLAEDELKKNLEAEVNKELEDEKKQGEQADEETETQEDNGSGPENDNPFQPDGSDPPPAQENNERRDSESFGTRVASAFREEFGLDEVEELEHLRQAGLDADREDALEDGNTESTAPEQEDRPPATLIEKILDWLWGDIRPPGAQEPVPPAREELQHADDETRQDEQGQEAPFVAMHDGEPAAQQQQHHPEGDENEANDPEVVAAAQQAGLDAEAVEDAEDLEGIFELIGVQGPLIGLFQTSAFCMLLVACTIAGAVFAPYVFGKVCLSLTANPVYFTIVMPLQIASFFADLVIDSFLMLGGYIVMVFALSMDWLLSVVKAFAPAPATGKIWEQLMQYSGTAASKAGARLADLVLTSAGGSEGEDWGWAFLGASVHAHASLQTIQGEVRWILDLTGQAITATADAISTGTVLHHLACALKTLPAATSRLLALTKYLPTRAEPLITFLSDLSRGRLRFTTPQVSLDPSLVHWSTTDRTTAIFAGYAALATLAAIYVAIDTPLTSSPSGKRREKQVRDSLRQAGGVLKVILIISIEMLVFPLYCGLLLDLAFLPLFPDATVSARWGWATGHPWRFCFVHWFVGTAYMFHFALFVGMCRKILRKGVLWFIRDPDDPNFHPVRDVLEKNVLTQLRKIAFSALVYGALVILCLGGVIWSIGKVFGGIFPVQWESTEPVLEFPLDLLLFTFATPLVIRLFRPSKVVNAMYAWWLRRCARVLRLSHFLFDERKRDEEGTSPSRLKNIMMLLRLNPADGDTPPADSEGAGQDDPSFHRNGTYVLTPCTDSYRPPKPNEAFLHANADDVYIADSNGKRNEHFAKVYLPPYFRVRIALFMVCLWAFSAALGLLGGLVPLVFGRRVFKGVIGGEGLWVNDIYAYLFGAYVLGGVGFVVLKGREALGVAREKVKSVDVKAALVRVRGFVARAARCAYVYGFLGVVLPMLMALTLHFYIVLPLTTYSASLADSTTTTDASSSPSPAAKTPASNQTSHSWLESTISPPQEPPSSSLQTLTEHSLHLLQEHALGILYVRILTRLILTTPTSRAAEAFRRITARGYLDPDVRLATRYFILPLSIIGTVLLCGPPILTQTVLACVPSRILASLSADDKLEDIKTKAFRYSYAASAALGFGIWSFRAVGRVLGRWRGRIKDEVYLVGERLHNFGEGRPPVGSRSVVRRER